MTRKSRLFWTLEKCKARALDFKTRSEWIKSCGGSYKSALKRGWLEECCLHMPTIIGGTPRQFSLDQCLEISKTFQNPQKWREGHPRSYKCAYLAGWYYPCTAHMTRLKGAWNSLEKCNKISINFTNSSEWRKASPSSYTYASKKGWLLQCTSHMVRLGGTSNKEKELLKIIKDKYPSAQSKRFSNKNKKFKSPCFEVDIYVPELNKAIEFDGKYWHGEGFARKWTNDPAIFAKTKDNFFKSINIQVLHICEKQWDSNKSFQIGAALKFLGAPCRIYS